ncbi:hypothetical protein QOZ80_1BG0052060 [Eleusine coracana subsp. coracana]|nr:hypothetical protein QOZ80_1BG0052060 [Eleusine coracana subsp. coracana]
MATTHHGGESAGDTRRKRRRLGDRDWRLRDEEWYQKRGTKAKPPTVAQSRDLLPPSSDDDRSAKVQTMVGEHVRRMLAVHAENKRLRSEFNRSVSEEPVLTVESTFGNCDDGSAESVGARRIALRVSGSIVSLSSFAGGKRIRVCSGFVMRWNDRANGRVILTAATLVRSLDGDNNVIPDLTVRVLLPDGSIADGNISLVDFHHNIAVVEVPPPNVKLVDAVIVEDIPDKGDVLALGRAYEGGKLMCSRGRIMYQTNTFGCSELLVSNCRISMAGAGGPLVNYDGHVLGINFYEKNNTSYLSMAIVSRILEHNQSFGKIIRPWLGIRYNALETVSLGVLERVYQKFPDVDKGLYISNVDSSIILVISSLSCYTSIRIDLKEKISKMIIRLLRAHLLISILQMACSDAKLKARWINITPR